MEQKTSEKLRDITTGMAPDLSESEVLPRDWDRDLTLHADQQPDHERTVARLRFFWEQRRLVAGLTAIGLVLATILAFLIPKQYVSTTRLMPPDSQSGSGLAALALLAGQAGVGAGTLASGLMGGKTTGELFVGVLDSRTVQDDVVNKCDLRKAYGTRYQEDARKLLRSRTETIHDKKSGLITITVKDKSPQRAAAIANAYVMELDRVVNNLSTSSAHRERVFLEERLKAVKQDLEEAEKGFSQFASNNAAIDIKEQGKAMVEAAAVLQGQLIAAESELQGLRQIYTENNARIRAATARVAELQGQLEKLGGSEMSQPQAGRSQSLYPSIKQLPLLGVTYADLYRRIKVDETVFEVLTQQYELARVAEVKDIPSVKVLDMAEIPEKKSFPPRLVIISVGTLFSFLIAVGWLKARRAWRETDPKDPRKLFARELFGTLKADLEWVSKSRSTPGRVSDESRKWF